MTEKLTDSVIVKALECLAKIGDNICLASEVLDLINRLQAENESLKQVAENQQKLSMDRHFEIEELKAENAKLQTLRANVLAVMGENIEQTKAEAYKEFAERARKIICDNTYPDFDKDGKAVNVWKAKVGYDEIDNLLKEMVGENNS